MNYNKLVLFFVVFLILVACNKETENKDFILRGGVFGTTYKITYLDAEKNYQDSIDNLFLKINNSVSTYIPTSDISKINNGDSTIEIDAIFSEVFIKSKRIYKETDGYFDPTVGNLVNAYGFGPKDEEINLSAEEVENQMLYVGLDKVTLKNRKINKRDSKIYLDFNSIAKGFGIDLVARFFDSKNVKNYLIEIGGEIRAKGTKKNNKPWIIQIVNPINPDSEELYSVINLSNKSMATSGNYRKYRITDSGKKYVHTINPKTGLATESTLLSVSVIGALDCADVDAYATAFMSMGLDKTKELIKNSSKLQIIAYYFDENGFMKEFSTYTYN
jgi:thiamine biosynthesis lipoprotein